MAGMMKKISDFARSPQGRELIAKGKKMAQDPQNQRKLQELRSRLGKQRSTRFLIGGRSFRLERQVASGQVVMVDV